MKEFLHYAIKVLLKLVLSFFKLFPVKRNRITLLNDLSLTYGDNLKYLNKFIQEKYPEEYEIIFPLKDRKSVDSALEKIVSIKPRTIKYFYYLLTSSVIVTNCGGLSYLPLRKSQLGLSTWHGGGPYKKTGENLFTSNWYKKELQLNKKNTKYILSSCKISSEQESKGMLFFEDDTLDYGSPRVDILFNDTSKIKQKVYERYSIDSSEKLIVFAPTFRSNTTDFTSKFNVFLADIDYQKVLNSFESRLGGKYRFAIRLHPRLKDIDLNLPNVINLTTYPDMQEILAAADVVITDFSSLMWDFSFTFRPCFLYAPDIDQYEKERGFYMPSSKWPFPIARNNDELEQEILNFDETEYVNKVKSHHQECGSYETGKACERIVNLIKDYINSTN